MTYDNAIVILLVAVSVLAFANYNQAKALRDNNRERETLLRYMRNLLDLREKERNGKQTTEERRD